MTYTSIIDRVAYGLCQAWRHILTAMVGLALPFALSQGASAQAIWGGGLIQQSRINQCTAGCLENDARKDAAGFCSYVCWCIAQQNKTENEARDLCLSQYTPPDAPNPLRKQEVVRAGKIYVPALAEGDVMKVSNHAKETQLNDYQVLDCTYVGTGVLFWYQKVPVTRAQLLAVSPLHPLRRLGDTAMNACPKTFAEAQQALQKQGRTPRDATAW